MEPTSVKEPVAVAEAELKATAMNAAANHQSLGAAISRLDRWLGANGIEFIEPLLLGTVRSDNGTSVPLRTPGWHLPGVGVARRPRANCFCPVGAIQFPPLFRSGATSQVFQSACISVDQRLKTLRLGVRFDTSSRPSPDEFVYPDDPHPSLRGTLSHPMGDGIILWNGYLG
jgi:hypothetical protein